MKLAKLGERPAACRPMRVQKYVRGVTLGLGAKCRHLATCRRDDAVKTSKSLMPSSQLRVSGSVRKVRRFLLTTQLKARPYKSGAGFNVTLAAYDGRSFKTRIKLVSKFLQDNRLEMLALKAAGFKSPLVDFGLYDETPPDRMWPMYRIPAPFIQLLAELEFQLELSFYGRRED